MRARWPVTTLTGVWLWEVATGNKRLLRLSAGGLVSRLLFPPAGRSLLALDPRAEPIEALDLAGGKGPRRLSVPGLARVEVELSPDGQLLVGVEHDGVLRLWDARSGRPLLAFAGHARAPMHLAFSAD